MAAGPQLAAYSATAKELSIDQAEAAEVPLSGGVGAGALVADGPTTEVTEGHHVRDRSRSRPRRRPTTKKAAATTAATTTAATTTAAAATTAAATTAAATSTDDCRSAPVGDGAPAGAQPW